MATRKKTTKLTFESGVAQMETIIAQLERGEMTLDESMQAYESGMEIYAQLEQLLQEGEARMEIIKNQSERAQAAQSTLFEVES